MPWLTAGMRLRAAAGAGAAPPPPPGGGGAGGGGGVRPGAAGGDEAGHEDGDETGGEETGGAAGHEGQRDLLAGAHPRAPTMRRSTATTTRQKTMPTRGVVAR